MITTQTSGDASATSARERFDTIVIGGGQAGLAAGYHLKKRGRAVRDPRRAASASATRGARAGTRSASSRRRSTPACPGCASRRPAGRSRRRTRWATTSRRTRSGSAAGAERRHASSASRGAAIAIVVEAGGAASRGRPRDRRDGRAPHAEGARVRTRARSADRAAALERVPEPGAAARRRRAGGRRRQLGRRDRVRARGAHRTCSRGRSRADPGPHGSRRSRLVVPVVWFVGHHVLTKGTRSAARSARRLAATATPLIRVKSRRSRGGRRRARRRGSSACATACPLLEDGRVLDVGERRLVHGLPRRTSRGSTCRCSTRTACPCTSAASSRPSPGLYFLGLVFQYSISSDVLPNRGRDAGYVAKHMAKRAARAR